MNLEFEENVMIFCGHFQVHAVGMYGDHGAGVGEERRLLDRMDIITGTLGKAFGLVGGYIVGSAKLVDTVRSYGSGFIFTTSLPPMVVRGAITSIDVLASEEGVRLRELHQRNAKMLRNRIVQAGIPVIFAPSHIIPVHVSSRCRAHDHLYPQTFCCGSRENAHRNF